MNFWLPGAKGGLSRMESPLFLHARVRNDAGVFDDEARQPDLSSVGVEAMGHGIALHGAFTLLGCGPPFNILRVRLALR